MSPTLLPPNATRAERAIARGIAAITGPAVPNAGLWSPATCPAALLPWLAWALSVDDWDPGWSESRRREVIAASVDLHRHKGTVGAIRRALRLAGYGDAAITEAWQLPRLGAAPPLGRSWRLGWSGITWADYDIGITRPVGRRDADALRDRLAAVAPMRCRLRRITLAGGVRHVLGRGVWDLGNQIPLGGVYHYEVQ
ncbi:phage tail protein I [Cereibacter changlensis JA139]|uniref:Phage tail protein I n=2 Tax=Cereibacter changlensis TaxID=402884 RepID=A0A2T4JNB1_9RHOB|nr:phage tail protein I [Cereibacter changlensis]PTE19376.1 phage tail protein I [Cereibacter changlensis JA139]PZX46822.1 phage tail P2-like protein [Cereibacter changlensis]